MAVKSKLFTLQILLFTFSLAAFGPLCAQDLLYEKTGKKIVVNITNETDELIFYKLFDSNDPSSYFVEKDILIKVRYADGREVVLDQSMAEFDYVTPADLVLVSEDYTDESKKIKSSMIDANSDLYLAGRRDANTYYKRYSGAATGTFLVTLLVPIAGLIPAAATSSSPPRLDNLGYPDPMKFEQSNYRVGYMDSAHEIKRKKVWTNFGVALGINLFLLLILVAGD